MNRQQRRPGKAAESDKKEAQGVPGENLRKTGNEMEDIAAQYLSERGVKILERNFRSREAEIDIIGEQDGTLVFVEVKARRSGKQSGEAEEAVGTAKQKRICRCADYYMFQREIDPFSVRMRFDVIAILVKEECEIRWIPNAFSYAGRSPIKPHWRVW